MDTHPESQKQATSGQITTADTFSRNPAEASGTSQPLQSVSTTAMSPIAIDPEVPVQNNSTSTPMQNPNAATDAPVLSSHPATILSTRPADDHHWRITLEGKVIAITGANRGIGLGIAEVCLANDAAIIYSLDLYAPGPEFLALQKKIGASRLQYIQCDVTSEESVNAAIDAIIEKSGAIHGMVANAGMTKHQPALNFSHAQLNDLFNLNVFGAYFCATAAARAFQRLGVKGSIVFTSSMTSYRPNRAAPSAPYGGTKAAVRNMAHTMAMEWASSGIRVNSVSPGFVKTAMTYYVEKSPDWADKMRYYGGMPRLAEPRELGGAYVYLLSEGASYTTAIDIPVNGVVGAW